MTSGLDEPWNTSKKKRMTFKLHAPAAEHVYVAGTFNDWDPEARPLKRAKNGNWSTWMSLPPGTYEYRFVVNGEWRDDPSCESRRPNDFGTHNSVFRL